MNASTPAVCRVFGGTQPSNPEHSRFGTPNLARLAFTGSKAALMAMLFAVTDMHTCAAAPCEPVPL